MKKVLIITYYWPPSAGAGVFRWLKFTKYLRDFGWEPIIYTPENPESPVADRSLRQDIPDGITIIKRPIWEPYQLYKTLTGKNQNEKVQAGFLSENREPGIADKVSTWLRGNFFIPDARKFWIKPSIKFLTQWLQQNHVDAMVSTGPPHSMHMIALGLKHRLGIPWLADFRDPWTQIDFYDKLMLSSFADKKHKLLERKVLEQADTIVTVSENCASDIESICNRKVKVITNGFDKDDFGALPEYSHHQFSITHLGAMNADRNPVALWKALGALITNNDYLKKHLTIRLIGKTDYAVKQSLDQCGLMPFAELLAYKPHHEALKLAAHTAILLLPLNNTPNVMGIAPGKLYEYLALRRPILCLGPPEGDAADIIRKTKSGVCIDFDDVEGCNSALLSFLKRFKANSLYVESQQLGNYSRKQLAGDVASLLNSIVRSDNSCKAHKNNQAG